jgi:dihydrofolate reductase
MYQVAMSADGYIAGPNGEHDWITMDPSIDFIAQCGQFDTAIMGRATYAKAIAMHGDASLPGLETVVFSRTLSPGSSGGGRLAAPLLEAGLIDSIDIAIMPVVLGNGVKLFETALPTKFLVADHVVLENSGVVVMRYAAADRLNGTPLINYVRRGDIDQGLVWQTADAILRQLITVLGPSAVLRAMNQAAES